MKRLGTRLVGGFLVLLLMNVAVAFYSSFASQRSLREAIGRSSVFVANEMLVNINMAVFNWLDRFELRALDGPVQKSLADSNLRFESIRSTDAYMDGMDAAWKAAVRGGISAAAQEVVGNPLSGIMRSLYFEHYEKAEGTRVVTEIVITNRYGAVVSATATPARYRFDQDELWRAARQSGALAGTIGRDETSGQAYIPLAVPVADEDGKFAGVIAVKISVNSILRNAFLTIKKYETTQVALTTLEGRLIYATREFRFMDDVSGAPYFTGIKGRSGSFVAEDGGRSVLYSYARSEPYLNFAGLPWILVMGDDVKEVLASSLTLRNGITAASGLLLVLGFLVAILISRSITKPLAELNLAATEITRGNLEHPIAVRGRDELGRLSQSFLEMQEALKGMTAFAARIASGDLTAQAVRRSEGDSLGIALENMLHNLRRQTREILDGVVVVAAAASEISASTSLFATNSAETAAAVSETTTTIEEVKQTVHLSNEKARSLADKARRTEEIAQAGRVSVEDTTQVMIGRIREQMDTIAESILRLSEQGASIGEITTTVSDLADQSNLLAVNAAIEAAKAGEQGKGFAVVAQEIKSLAEQSKKATTQVRSILTEIQKATGGAVMATEQGSKAVDEGMKQAAESKESIKSLAETVAEAAMGAAQIAASSEQQRVGMDQVAMAMESIKVATTLGVERTKRLEEEAQNLHGVGTRLRQLVELVRM